jgi:SAM-dependent methyltransferase
MPLVKDPADVELKSRHRAMWALGDYPAVAAEVIPDLGDLLVDACGVREGDSVLDVACGSGNVAIPAALRGAKVTGCDLTPELLEAGRRLAARRGAEVTWREGDAEALPFTDGSFDVVLSCVGVMFAPHHQVAAAELLRVCRPGGTIGLVSWTPEGFVGQMLGAMKPFLAPPPPGAQPPPLWGDESHARGLLDDGVGDVCMTRHEVVVEAFATPAAFVDFFRTSYGPTVAAYRALAEEPARAAALDEALGELARRHDRGTGRTVMGWEYLLVKATRSA